MEKKKKTHTISQSLLCFSILCPRLPSSLLNLTNKELGNISSRFPIWDTTINSVEGRKGGKKRRVPIHCSIISSLHRHAIPQNAFQTQTQLHSQRKPHFRTDFWDSSHAASKVLHQES